MIALSVDPSLEVRRYSVILVLPPPLVSGLAGDDVLLGSLSQSNYLSGGPGSDTITGGRGVDILSSGSQVDIQGGTYFQDGRLDRNELRGLGGDDNIGIGNGIDIVFGGSGVDFITIEHGSTINFLQTGGAGRDVIDGQGGNDVIIHGDDGSRIRGGSGNDAIVAGLGNDNVNGGSGSDRIRGDLGNIVDAPEIIILSRGFYQRAYDAYLEERIRRRGGNDKIDGGSGNDRIYGEGGVDTLRGGGDNDTIFGGSGNDRLFGDRGNDSILGGDGIDRIDGGEGRNTLRGQKGNDQIIVGDTKNKFSVDFADGGDGRDEFFIANRSTFRQGSVSAEGFVSTIDSPHTVVGGKGKDIFNFQPNSLNGFGIETYGNSQYTSIQDFAKGEDRIFFELGKRADYELRFNSDSTDIFYKVDARFDIGIGAGAVPGGGLFDIYKVHVARVEGLTDLSLFDSSVFTFQ